MNDKKYQESRKEMVRQLKNSGIIRTRKVEEAFLSVPREKFIPKLFTKHAYIDRPLSIGKGQTISAPHMVAIMAEELLLEPGLRVLEIGGGSGYHAAITGHIIGDDGIVISIETVSELASAAARSLKETGITNVKMIEGDGSVGHPEESPYDRVYYTCAAPYVPEVIKDQVRLKGIILSVEGSPLSVQRLIRYRKKKDNKWEEEPLTSCVFVPLIGKEGHR